MSCRYTGEKESQKGQGLCQPGRADTDAWTQRGRVTVCLFEICVSAVVLRSSGSAAALLSDKGVYLAEAARRGGLKCYSRTPLPGDLGARSIHGGALATVRAAAITVAFILRCTRANRGHGVINGALLRQILFSVIAPEFLVECVSGS
ncbi:hypothetical protein AAFF_G00278560 [Aldrovandia affinis]|uniref:Uncharacterized protein n=1 Tax=Aldrovandia affinis TaxID=143900 RepID=A0AAD7SR23_9TELE|nr:hypothetical protein AAFF_G00278560 [Aldrovandia affinis]